MCGSQVTNGSEVNGRRKNEGILEHHGCSKTFLETIEAHMHEVAICNHDIDIFWNLPTVSASNDDDTGAKGSKESVAS